MSGTIARARAVLSDPDSAPSEKIHMVGLLAIALIAAEMSGPETDEARAIVRAFWQERAVQR